MRFVTDPSQPLDSINHHWAETSYDGQPGSWVPEIGRHWHKHHDEYMQVLSGRIAFTLDSESVILTPESGVLHIPKWHVHGFKFFEGEATSFTEKTDPPGDFKEAFFGDLFAEGQISFTTAMRAFYDGDTYVALPGGIKIVDEAFTTVVGGVMKWMYPRKAAVIPSSSAAAMK